MKYIATTLLALVTALPALCSDFDAAVSEIMANNLNQRAQQARSAARISAIEAENNLEGIEVEFSHLWGTQSAYGNRWTLSVTQSFDWPGLYAARREAARRCASAEQLAVENSFMDLRQQVRELLVEIIHTNRLIALQSEWVERVDSMEMYFRIAAEQGAETRLDYNKAVLERIAVHRDLHTLEGQLDALAAQLQSFNGGRAVSAIIASLGTDYPVWPEVDRMASPDIVRERDAAYGAAVASAEAARSLASVERRRLFPGFSVGYEHEVEGPEVYNGLSVGLRLPSWGSSKSVKSADFEVASATADAEAILAQRLAGIEADRRQLEAIRTIIDEYSPVVNDPRNFALLRRALQAGQITFLTYIQEMNYFIEAYRDYYDAVCQYNLTLVRLGRYI